MAPKERRKGKKEIHKDNEETLAFYLKFTIVGTVVQACHLALHCVLSGGFHILDINIALFLFGVAVQLAGQKLLRSMARPSLGGAGQLLDCGTDLSSSFIAEYAIDFVILTSALQVLSAVSNWFWLLWLLAPGYLFYRLWVLLIWPWFTSGGPDPGQGQPPKRAKMRRAH